MEFLGIDLGWQGKPSGLALLEWNGKRLALAHLSRPGGREELLASIDELVSPGEPVWAGLDAPVIIRNESGMRAADRMAHSLFARQHAGAYPVNLALPFALPVGAFVQAMVNRGFATAPPAEFQTATRQLFEVYPHAAALRLFALPRILGYKKGPLAKRREALLEFRRLLMEGLAQRKPALRPPGLPLPCETLASLKECEDQLDAVLCAYVAAHYWYWGLARTNLLGDPPNGYIVNPSF